MSPADLIRILLEAGIAGQLLLFAAYLLFAVQRRRPAHLALAVLSLAIGLSSLINTLAFAGGWVAIRTINIALELMISPAIFLFVLQSRADPPPVGWRDLLHGLPAIAGLLLWSMPWLVPLNSYILIIHTGYLIAGGYALMATRGGQPVSGIRLHLWALVGFLAVFTALRLMIGFEVALGATTFRDGWAYPVMLVLLLSLSASMVITVLRNPGLLADSPAFSRYAGSDLSEGEVELILQRLNTVLVEERAFTDPELALDELAARIRAPARHVSQTINQHFGMGVPAYLNERRAEDVAGQFQSDPDRSVTEAMIAAGFGSKNTFLRAFRKRYGQTPRAYRDDLRAGADE